MWEDSRITRIACYDLNCRYNMANVSEPTCLLKLVLIEPGGVCKYREERNAE
jgi:hypothetical protein